MDTKRVTFTDGNGRHYLRTILYILGDFSAAFAATLFAITLFTEGGVFVEANIAKLLGAPLFSIAGLYAMGMYKVSWRHTGLSEMVGIGCGLGIGFFLFLGLCLFTGNVNFFVEGGAFLALSTSVILVGGFRISRRLYNEFLKQPSKPASVVIFGAGNAGDQIIRDVARHPDWKLTIDALFDDDQSLHGLKIHGVKVLGNREHLLDYLQNHKVSQLIIAAPSMSKQKLKELTNNVSEISKTEIKILPAFHRLSGDPISVHDLREIRLEDILGRDPVEIDMDHICSYVKNKTVLITGAGGSIGSEIVRQTLKFSPAKVIAAEIDETELFHLENELSQHEEKVIYCLADVTNYNKMEHIFRSHSIDLIFHAAAYKHVPMMERHPEEAVRTNVRGTKTVAMLASEYQAERMVMISTDKVVNPTNVMGATKRVAEQICNAYDQLSNTRYISVRFGNVLGSRGSVIPLFMDQIKNGDPVTVTDAGMTRYFMTIPEAVLLVMQAGSMGKGGEVFVLDMGEPVKIEEMAKELIRLHGLKPGVDIPIKYKGIRPGEKLYEELLTDEEGVDKTTSEQIFKARNHREQDESILNGTLDELMYHSEKADHSEVRRLLKILVPSYQTNDEIIFSENGKQSGHKKKEAGKVHDDVRELKIED